MPLLGHTSPDGYRGRKLPHSPPRTASPASADGATYLLRATLGINRQRPDGNEPLAGTHTGFYL